jgi:hypothetical protein
MACYHFKTTHHQSPAYPGVSLLMAIALNSKIRCGFQLGTLLLYDVTAGALKQNILADGKISLIKSPAYTEISAKSN